jgi:hypothetical protein
MTGGMLALSQFSTVQGMLFDQVTVAVDPSAQGDVLLSGCNFDRCDLTATEWRHFRFCVFSDCQLPSVGHPRDAVESLIRFAGPSFSQD